MAPAAAPATGSASEDSTVSYSPPDSAIVTSWHRTQISTDEFSVTWTVPNFSSYLEENVLPRHIASPKFSVGFAKSVKWMLLLHQSDEVGYIPLCLSLLTGFAREAFRHYNFDFYLSSVEDEKAHHKRDYLYDRGDRCTGVFFTNTLIQLEFLVDPVNGLLPDDKLTIICEAFAATQRLDSWEPSYEHSIELHDYKRPEYFGSLLEDQKFCDFTVSVGDRELRVHKAILAARSSVFAAMFSHEMKEKAENQVVVTDIDYEVLREMVEYIYTGRSRNVAKMGEDLLVAADKYDVPGLKVLCEKVLHSKLTVENTATLLILADTHCAKYLKPRIISFICKNARRVSKTPAWKNITSTHPHLIAEAFVALACGSQGSTDDG